MKGAPGRNPVVAVLLPTFNSSRFIEAQLASLADNETAFTLHWLDDHSQDDTGEKVRSCAAAAGIEITRWTWPERLGVPAAFFQLLESVDADVYLFCDHDDVWQPGKIDATVAALRSDVTMCFSEPLVFNDAAPERLRPYFQVADIELSSNPTRSFWSNPAVGNTMGFTKALREVYLPTAPIARRSAIMHDWWMYLLARCTGGVQFMQDVPTTLYRQHRGNVFGARGSRDWTSRWTRLQTHRYNVARQAQGFMEATPALPPYPDRERLLADAGLFATLSRRQSPGELVNLLKRGALPPGLARLIFFSVSNLLFDVRPARGC